MADTQVFFPWAYVPDPTSGRPISLGSMFFGIKDLDPEVPANQIQLKVKQEDGTVLNVNQPILLNAGGVPTYLGSPVILVVTETEFSIKVLNSLGGQVYYNENNIQNSDVVGPDQIENGAVTTPKLADNSVTTVKIANGNVTGVKLNSAVAGNGLSQNGSGNLDVNVDNSTLEISGDQLRVKANGIGASQIASNAVGSLELADNSVNTAAVQDAAINHDKLGQGLSALNLLASFDAGISFNTFYEFESIFDAGGQGYERFVVELTGAISTLAGGGLTLFIQYTLNNGVSWEGIPVIVSGSRLSLDMCIIDIDGLKNVNQRLGFPPAYVIGSMNRYMSSRTLGYDLYASVSADLASRPTGFRLSANFLQDPFRPQSIRIYGKLENL